MRNSGCGIVTDARAGVEINLPMAMVEFGRYEFPFAQYDSPSTTAACASCSSASKAPAAPLPGLYEIMQTLEIVPLEGERNRANGDSFLS